MNDLAIFTSSTLLRRKGHNKGSPISSSTGMAGWLDFVPDQLARGRRFRILDVVNDVTQECLTGGP